jgi:molybdate transport system substrate-binding protein
MTMLHCPRPDPVPVRLARIPGIFRACLLLAGGLGLYGSGASGAEEPVRIAVAANFKQTMERLAADFAKKNGELAPVVSSGASGLLYSQIVQGAPFDVFFSADQDRPARLEQDGLVVAGSRYTYAVGKLVLWRPGRASGGTLEQALKGPDVKVVSIANPAVAPYGAAAQQVLEKLGLWPMPPFRVVQGESLGQAFQFVATGNAQIGFIALSQVKEATSPAQGNIADEVLEIDPRLYAPLAQDAVRLQRSAGKPAVGRFLDFVRSPEGRATIAAAGYAPDP